MPAPQSNASTRDEVEDHHSSKKWILKMFIHESLCVCRKKKHKKTSKHKLRKHSHSDGSSDERHERKSKKVKKLKESKKRKRHDSDLD